MESDSNGDTENRSAIIEHLIAIWSRVLQVSPVFPESDFFELGGDSLLAVGLFLEIERTMGVSLPLTTIYDAPTVSALADVIASGDAPDYSRLVPLNDGGVGAPFFFVHGLGGTVMELAALGRTIATERPIFAIQARGLDGKEPPIDNIEEMAALYVEDIRQKQPAGPYFIGGYSFGGLVAFEMARLFGAENVALLVMVDAYAHPRTWPLKTRVLVRGQRARRRLRLFRQRPVRESAGFFYRTARKLVARRPPAGGSNMPEVWLGRADPNLPLPLQDVRNAAAISVLDYKPAYYPGKVTFLRAATTGAVFPRDPSPIWSPLSAEFELHTVEGNHASMIVGEVSSIAGCISACLAEASPVGDAARAPLRAPRHRSAEKMLLQSEPAA